MNYEEIKDTALQYSMRKDSATLAMMDGFLKIVEARLNRALDVKDMYFRAVLETEEEKGYYGLPNDFLSMRDIQIQESLAEGDRTTLMYVSPEVMNAAQSVGDTGTDGIIYTIIANQIQIYPYQDAQILQVVYRKRLIALSDAAPRNWLSEQSPDAYIFGLLVEIFSFARDSQSSQLWESRFTNSVAVLNSKDKENKWSGTTLRINTEY